VRRNGTVSLASLFGAIYFVQGFGDPATGLITQPLRSLHQAAGHDAATIARFAAVTSLPWALKPLLGLLCDAVPLRGQHRRSWLILAMTATLAGSLALYAANASFFVWAVLVATFGVALADVATDALMIERGQPHGITGVLQSVQWAAMYAGTMLAAVVGGWLSERGAQREGFLWCALLVLVGLVLAVGFAREEPRRTRHRPVGVTLALLVRAGASKGVLVIGAFLFLWNFNPFCNTVLYVHLVRELGIGEQAYGNSSAVMSAGAILGSVTYGVWCRRVSYAALVHVSITAGVASTLAYGLVGGELSLYAVSAVVGFTYMTGSLVQLDLAAQVCPRRWAGTLFATLMALSNISIAASEALGGELYEGWCASAGSGSSFVRLVLTGAAFTASCWLLAPLLMRVHTRSAR
jgi:MFS family permease